MNKLVSIVIGSVVVAVSSAVVSAISIIRNKRSSKEIEEITKKLDLSMKDIQKMSSEEITESMIRESVKKSADKKVDRYMQNTEDDVLRAAEKTLTATAREAVERSANDIREQASEKISQQVASLDIDELKIRVCDQAEKHVLKKLDGCLDASAKKFQDQLDNTRKVYDGIAKAMAKKEAERIDNDPFHVLLL